MIYLTKYSFSDEEFWISTENGCVWNRDKSLVMPELFENSDEVDVHDYNKREMRSYWERHLSVQNTIFICEGDFDD